MHVPAATLPETIVGMAEEACTELDISHRRIVSYAGHDGQVMSQFTRAGMIFVPSVGGISHNPKEFTRWEHVIQGTNVLLRTAIKLASTYAPVKS
jgi:N-carbamoyl-L-amino-acid hydrolase